MRIEIRLKLFFKVRLCYIITLIDSFSNLSGFLRRFVLAFSLNHTASSS